MEIKLYNTMSRRIEKFESIVPGEVSFYSCGPTVYDYAHIGNLRSFILADLLKRVLTANGYRVRHVMNITDVGHLTDDEQLSDSGEDKMEKGSRRTGKSVWDIAKFYTNAFFDDIRDLNIIPAAAYPKATEYIQEQINMVRRLEELGYTYRIDGDGIYYDTSKFADYGKLGGQNLEDLKAGARVEFVEGKRNITDFVLWKFPSGGEKRQMEWDSPWGVGFPGWHIECSAMSLKLLGERLDIHSGGVDHIKIHHQNEIAQTEPIVGHKWVNYWVHGEFLNDVTGKMSKSKGDFLSLSVLKARGHSPIAYRYFLLLSSYRTQIDFSFELLDAAAKAYDNLARRVKNLLADESLPEEGIVAAYRERIMLHLNSDLGTPGAIAVLQEALRDEKILPATKLEIVKFTDSVLGLRLCDDAATLRESEADVPASIAALAEERQAAKTAKDYAKADEIRAKIESMGYAVEDGKDGVSVRRKV